MLRLHRAARIRFHDQYATFIAADRCVTGKPKIKMIKGCARIIGLVTAAVKRKLIFALFVLPKDISYFAPVGTLHLYLIAILLVIRYCDPEDVRSPRGSGNACPVKL